MESKYEFDKGFYKLMNSAVYDKTMENVRNHSNIKLVTTNSKRKILVSKPNYHNCKRFSKDLMVIELKKTNVDMNKSIYVG